jgi:hypothetical protein
VQTAFAARDKVLSVKKACREGTMSRYVVQFMKDVLGGNGRQIEICQQSLEIDALSADQAMELAKQKFCETERLCEWSLHADRIRTDLAA